MFIRTVDPAAIRNPVVRAFYREYQPGRLALREFYHELDIEFYDVHVATTRPPTGYTPRDNLAHMIEVTLVYYNGIRTGELSFADMTITRYRTLSKNELLAEADRTEELIFGMFTNRGFDASRRVACPWGLDHAGHLLHRLRDNDLVHIGLCLAVAGKLPTVETPALHHFWQTVTWPEMT